MRRAGRCLAGVIATPFRIALVLAVAAAAVVAVPSASALADTSTARPLVSKLRADNLDATVLAKGNKQALYYWNREDDGQIRCTGACAVAWPPYLLPKGAKVPKRIAGFDGTFGTVKRPGSGKRQLTYDGRPLYTYAHESRGVVLCDDVDGWFAIRL